MTLSEVCRGTAEEEVEWSLLSLPETSEAMSVVGGFRWIVEKKLSEIKGEAFLCSGRVRQCSDRSEWYYKEERGEKEEDEWDEVIDIAKTKTNAWVHYS